MSDPEKRPSVSPLDVNLSSSGSSVEKHGEHDVVNAYDVDVAAQLTSGTGVAIDPAESARVRRKIDLHLMPLMCGACPVPSVELLVWR